MTRREQEILAWIRDNPLISQQELAQRAGITRSSVAVHISNLMRKGLKTNDDVPLRWRDEVQALLEEAQV